MSLVHSFTTDWAYLKLREELTEKIKKETDSGKKDQLERELNDMDNRHRMICT